ncbi:MAG: hypothetical protein ABR497_00290 [Kiritimatiellia bacterium]|nr:hypothetical protein [Lentisphaerota bacterium]
MPRETITRRAADNVYLHRDFHCALNEALDYLDANYGAAAVREYLRRFAASYHAPLTAAICRRGLPALREYLEEIYRIEGGRMKLAGDADQLRLEVLECPAVVHIRRQGRQPCARFVETVRTVYATICTGTPFVFTLLDYDPATGAGVRLFKRRLP